MKNIAALIALICLICFIAACRRYAAPAPQSVTVLTEESTTRSNEQILSNMRSILPGYEGSGTVSKVYELISSGKTVMCVKYSFAKQEDILAYAASLELNEEWIPPRYEGDSYCMEHKFGESHSVRINYYPVEKENNFEIRITMYKPVG